MPKKGPRILYREGYKYQLNQEYVVQLDNVRPKAGANADTPLITLSPTGLLTIRYGYAWDGASGPTRDTKSSMRGSLVHDALYQLGRMKVLDDDQRSEADEVFWRICRTDGMWRARAFIWWRAVVRFAKGSFFADDRPVRSAPW